MEAGRQARKVKDIKKVRKQDIKRANCKKSFFYNWKRVGEERARNQALGERTEKSQMRDCSQIRNKESQQENSWYACKCGARKERRENARKQV